MGFVEKSVEFFRSPAGFTSEVIDSFGGYAGMLALSIADVEPSWLAKGPLVVSALSYVALVDNIFNGSQSEQTPTE